MAEFEVGGVPGATEFMIAVAKKAPRVLRDKWDEVASLITYSTHHDSPETCWSVHVDNGGSRGRHFPPKPTDF